MDNEPESKPAEMQSPIYQIRLKGHLGPHRMDWFEGLSITLEADGTTLLSGPVVDQAALHGLLRRIRDLGTPLLSVNRVGSGRVRGDRSTFN